MTTDMERVVFYLGGMRIEFRTAHDAYALAPVVPRPAGADDVMRAIAAAPGASGPATILLPDGAGEAEGRAAAEGACRFLLECTTPRPVSFVCPPGMFTDVAAGAEKILASMAAKTFRNPVPTVDIIIALGAGVVLVRRRNPPPGWAIPGGFVDYGESLEDAAVREAYEETGLALKALRQFHTYSAPGRDPRHHTISTVFTAEADGTPRAGDDALEVRVFPPREPPPEMAFDHADILAAYAAASEAGMTTS